MQVTRPAFARQSDNNWGQTPIIVLVADRASEDFG